MVGGYDSGDVLLPDFLDQHNGADLPGLLPNIRESKGFPVTRYCVEILDVQLPGIITASADGRPQTAPFADFLSCNEGQCRCMHQLDRAVAHLPARQIRELCVGNPPADLLNNTCRCPELSMNQSRRYVGRSPIPLPFYIAVVMVPHPDRIPPGYPPSFRPEPMGSFHSFPAGGHCPVGASVGDGSCTWQQSPVAHTVYLDDVVRMGFNVSDSVLHKTLIETTGEVISEEGDYDASIRNLRIMERAFAALRMPPCGEPPVAGTGDAAAVVVV